MELLTSLNSYLQKYPRRLTTEFVVRLGMDISKALIVMQKNRLIHRDIKPANVFVDA